MPGLGTRGSRLARLSMLLRQPESTSAVIDRRRRDRRRPSPAESRCVPYHIRARARDRLRARRDAARSRRHAARPSERSPSRKTARTRPSLSSLRATCGDSTKWPPLHHSGVVDDASVDDGQNGSDLPDLDVRNGEIIAVEYREVGKPAGFDRADPVFHLQEPAVLAGEKAKRLLACQLLVAVHLVAKRIH